jgi:hypothetical protein
MSNIGVRLTLMKRYLISTEHGEVLAELDETLRNALDGPLFTLSRPTPEARRDAPFEVPLRAFSAKMIDIIEGIGVGDFKADSKVIELLKKEKATDELARIERWAKANPV